MTTDHSANRATLRRIAYQKMLLSSRIGERLDALGCEPVLLAGEGPPWRQPSRSFSSA